MPLVYTDSYKLSHKGFMNENTEVIYSNLTPRSLRLFPDIPTVDNPEIVFFGLQYFIKDFLMDEWNRKFFSKPRDVVVNKFMRLVNCYLGEGAVERGHFEALHDLGYLPILIKALPEGTITHEKIPVLTIHNTHTDFAWLTNYLETVLSSELWKPMTVASIMHNWRKLVNKFAMETTGSLAGTEFQLHDFSSRGMSGRHDSAICGAAFLLSSNGTDTVSAIDLIEEYYNADLEKEFIGTSVPASEHMIACLGSSVEGELESYRKWITKDYPTGIVSLVSDTYDYWRVLTEYLPALKEDILARKENALGLAKVVIRPDSGNPADIICGVRPKQRSENPTPEEKGSIEILWDIFGGTVNELGYKVLHPRIGLIYGDSMTPERVHDILVRLKEKGFASTNVVFGVGSYSLQYLTRDTLGIAVKATWAKVDGKSYSLFKAPKTDNGVKNSAKGLLKVVRDQSGKLQLLEDEEDMLGGLLVPVFENGELLVDQKYSDIRRNCNQPLPESSCVTCLTEDAVAL